MALLSDFAASVDISGDSRAMMVSQTHGAKKKKKKEFNRPTGVCLCVQLILVGK